MNEWLSLSSTRTTVIVTKISKIIRRNISQNMCHLSVGIKYHIQNFSRKSGDDFKYVIIIF